MIYYNKIEKNVQGIERGIKMSQKASITIRNKEFTYGKTLICVSDTANDSSGVIGDAKKIVAAKADLIEWRLDCFDFIDDKDKVKETLTGLRQVLGDMPLILTFRTDKEGGNRSLSIDKYKETYLYIASLGLVDIYDVEMWIAAQDSSSFVEKLKAAGKVIFSKHDFNQTPSKEKIIDALIQMQEAGADIAKIALMPQSKEDVDALMEASIEVTEKNPKTPIITISMGEMGRESRIQGKKTGSCLTFAVVGKASAPGQVDIQELRELMK